MAWLGRYRKQVMLGLLALLTVGAVVLAIRMPAAGRVEVILPDPAAQATPASLRVYVCGAVAQPDVYVLAAGSIIKDAILAAGGATAEADLTRINLAQTLNDQTQVFVPTLGEPAPLTPVTRGIGIAGGLINLNTASPDDLDTLPGIGPALAERIIERRPYRNVQELLDVPGIGPATYDKLKDKVTAP